MINGAVNNHREPRIPLTLSGPGSRPQIVDAVVDTGFTGELALPQRLVSALGLVQRGYGRAILADGRSAVFAVYTATAIWHGVSRVVETEAADTDPLVGMGLLAGSDLSIACRPHASVTIQPHV